MGRDHGGKVQLWGMVAISLVAGLLFACSGQTRLMGTDLKRQAAPDFHLRDGSGQAYTLSQFKGKAVVLTFLYTHCPDYCPLTAELLRHADESAGHPKNAVYLAVSVDPTGDTPKSVATFNAQHHLDELGERWHYLIGSLPELESVWHSYYVDASPEVGVNGGGHSSVLFFIDRQGNERSLSEIDASAESIARNVLILTKS
ncbi:MAG: SCO family protein [Dehalococcoidia bacterium]